MWAIVHAMSRVHRLPPRPDRIARARIEAGLTPENLADLVGVSRQSIWYYETGDRVPRADRLAKIAEATGKPIAYFLPEEETASV